MNDEAAIGHNNPPTEAHDPALYEKLSTSVENFNTAAAEWIKKGKVEDVETSEKLTDFIAGARKLRQIVDKNRREQKAQWDALGGEVQTAYKTLLDRIDAIAKTPNAMQADWLSRERQRKEQERVEAIRKAAEEKARAEEKLRQAEARTDMAGLADAEKALKDTEKQEKKAQKGVSAKSGSASGGTRSMGLRTIKTAKVTNIARLFTHYRDRPEVEEVLVRLANADLRSPDVDDSSIPGIEIVMEEKAV